MTRTSENESYEDFIERVKKNPQAAAVMINDLTDNMDIRRLPYLSDKDVKRPKKDLKAYKRLAGHPNAYNPWTEEDDETLTQMWNEGRSAQSSHV